MFLFLWLDVRNTRTLDVLDMVEDARVMMVLVWVRHLILINNVMGCSYQDILFTHQRQVLLAFGAWWVFILDPADTYWCGCNGMQKSFRLAMRSQIYLPPVINWLFSWTSVIIMLPCDLSVVWQVDMTWFSPFSTKTRKLFLCILGLFECLKMQTFESAIQSASFRKRDRLCVKYKNAIFFFWTNYLNFCRKRICTK